MLPRPIVKPARQIIGGCKQKVPGLLHRGLFIPCLKCQQPWSTYFGPLPIWRQIELANQLLSDQFAYKNTGITTCALVQTLDFITKSLDKTNCHSVSAIFVDLSKAFDVVDHDILLEKMRGLNLPLNIYEWTKSFLTGRKQIVSINSSESLMEPIIWGIVQGSALGPFLFISASFYGVKTALMAATV